jgi:hypothetical protein
MPRISSWGIISRPCGTETFPLPVPSTDVLGYIQPSLRDCSVTDPDPGFYILPLEPFQGLFIRSAAKRSRGTCSAPFLNATRASCIGFSTLGLVEQPAPRKRSRVHTLPRKPLRGLLITATFFTEKIVVLSVSTKIGWTSCCHRSLRCRSAWLAPQS